jgi:hypothetical protein
MRTWIERVPVDPYFGRLLDDVKAMKRMGWDMAALLAPDKKEVVVLGFYHGLGGPYGGHARDPAPSSEVTPSP